MSGPNELAALKRHVDHGLVSSGTRQTLASLIALIESQRATIERVERERDEAWGQAHLGHSRAEAAEARVTALEAEKAVSRDVLMDPVAVHLNLLRGGIAKPSVDNIAHLYPEVWAMKEALIATLKHFRHPTSAEHETRDKVMAALAPFGELPLTPMALSRSTEVKNDER
jgi:hypothetical protein